MSDIKRKIDKATFLLIIHLLGVITHFFQSAGECYPNHMILPIEDTFSDVLRKALRSLNLSPNELAWPTGAKEAEIQFLFDGVWSDGVGRNVARALGLRAEIRGSLGAKCVDAKTDSRLTAYPDNGAARYDTKG